MDAHTTCFHSAVLSSATINKLAKPTFSVQRVDLNAVFWEWDDGATEVIYKWKATENKLQLVTTEMFVFRSWTVTLFGDKLVSLAVCDFATPV